MQHREIAKLVIDFTAGLLVHPQMDGQLSYEYIYREASGLRWNKEKQALCACEPSRWEHEELLTNMASALRSCCDEKLCFTEKTERHGVSPELRVRLLRVLSVTQSP